MRSRLVASLLTVVVSAGLAACSSDSGSTAAPTPSETSNQVTASFAPSFDDATFSTDITNPYWPMPVGARWTYREVEGREVHLVEVTVTGQTKTVAAGVEARVVRDVVRMNGRIVEDTRDWYAQDSDGNVWYLGEATVEYAPGEPPSREGSWEAGVDGAQAGVLIPGDPAPGMSYRQEYLAGEAEDQAVVLSVDEMAQVPLGHYTGALLTRETTPLEPDVSELKYYAKGVGPVLVMQSSGGRATEELLAARGLPDS